MTKAKTALITGVTGQDGAYLARLLLDDTGRAPNGRLQSMVTWYDRLPRGQLAAQVGAAPGRVTCSLGVSRRARVPESNRLHP